MKWLALALASTAAILFLVGAVPDITATRCQLCGRIHHA